MTDNFLRRVHDEMGVTAAERLADDVRALRVREIAAIVPRERLVAELVTGASVAGTLPDDLVEQIASRHDEARRHADVAEDLNEVASQLDEIAKSTRRTEIDRGLDLLRAEMDEVLRAARPLVSALGNVASPLSAIESGHAEQWKELDHLATRLREVRRVQRLIIDNGRLNSQRNSSIGADELQKSWNMASKSPPSRIGARITESKVLSGFLFPFAARTFLRHVSTHDRDLLKLSSRPSARPRSRPRGRTPRTPPLARASGCLAPDKYYGSGGRALNAR